MAEIIAVLNDLIFATKIAATARSMGIEARTVSTIEAVEAELASGNVRLVLVDMESSGSLAEMVLKAVACRQPKPSVVAFHPHVRADLGEQATKAGADLVLPRSKFSAELPTILRRFTSVS